MSTAPKVAKLEALLARIQSRMAEPRQTAVPAAGAPPPAPSPHAKAYAAPAVVAPVFVPPPTPEPPVIPPLATPIIPMPVEGSASVPEAIDEPTIPPPAASVDESTVPPPPLAADRELGSGDADIAVDVDVSEVALEPSIPPPRVIERELPSRGEVRALGPADSQERLAVTESMASESPLSGGDTADAAPAIEQVEILADDDSLAGAEDDEIEESPASSRRAVTTAPEERLADLAFGSEEPPQRHTPPPKSGRLPSPPGADLEADITGVHKTESIIVDEPTRVVERVEEPLSLEPQATRPTLASSVNFVDVIGQAQRFAPSTFAELLDASLSL